MPFSWQCKIISSCLCMLYFWNTLNFSVKVAWVNRIRKRFILMTPLHRSDSCHTADLPHFHPFVCPSLIIEIVISVYSPRQLCWLLITCQNLSDERNVTEAIRDIIWPFTAFLASFFVLRAKTRFRYLSCSAPSLINYLKKLLPSEVMFLMIFLVV